LIISILCVQLFFSFVLSFFLSLGKRDRRSRITTIQGEYGTHQILIENAHEEYAAPPRSKTKKKILISKSLTIS